jgi:hypothetical protein
VIVPSFARLPRQHGRVALGILLLIALTLSACSMSPQNRATQLHDAVFGYNEAVRWGRIERAADWIPDRERGAFVAKKRAAWAGMAVLDVEVRDVNVASDQASARVRVIVRFSQNGNPVMRSHLVEQHWSWAPQGWMLVARKQVEMPTANPSADPSDLY